MVLASVLQRVFLLLSPPSWAVDSSVAERHLEILPSHLDGYSQRSSLMAKQMFDLLEHFKDSLILKMQKRYPTVPSTSPHLS